MTAKPHQQFCTFFDSGYLPAGIALYHSLSETLRDIDLRVLCLDHTTADVLERLDLPGVHPVHLAELESFDPALAGVKESRSRPEYYFTSKPAYVKYLLKTEEPHRLTYLDADLYFFRSPNDLLTDWSDASVVVHAHNFPSGSDDVSSRVGRFNAGFLSVRNDDVGVACIDRWREQCLDWCYDRVESDRYADQKYLDEWPDRWDAATLDRPGVGTARWNVDRWSYSIREDGIYVDGKPLIFYHFEGLQRLTKRVWNPHASLPDVVERQVYRPYIRRRLRVEERVRRNTGVLVRDGTYRLSLIARGNGVLGSLARTLYRTVDTGWAGLKGDLLYVRLPRRRRKTGDSVPTSALEGSTMSVESDGALVSTVGFGTGRLSDEEAYEAISTALKAGYRFFDTARLYESERVLGTALAESDVDRSEVFIGSKVGSHQLGYESVFEEVDRSLEALDTNYLDLLYVHWPAHEYDPEQTFRAFGELRSEQRIGAIGICNVTVELLVEAIERSPVSIDFVQIEFHPYLFQGELLKVAAAHDISIIAESPLANGRVIDDPTVDQVAEAEGVTEAQVVLAWCLEHGTVPIPSSSNTQHIRENFRARDIEISPETRDTLDGLDVGFRVNDYEFAPWNDRSDPP